MRFLVDDNKKILIGFNRRAGCSTVKKWFFNVIGVDLKIKGSNVHEAAENLPQYWALNVDRDKDYSEYTKIVVFRNPYSRIRSGYWGRVITGKVGNCNTMFDLIDLLEEKDCNVGHFFPQTGEDFVDLDWDYICFTETLDNDLERVNAEIGVDIPIPKIFTTPKSRKKEIELTERMRERIFKIYKKDFEYYSYLKYKKL